MPPAHIPATKARIRLPGFGLPLTTRQYLDSVGPLQPHLPKDKKLPNALIGVSLVP